MRDETIELDWKDMPSEMKAWYLDQLQRQQQEQEAKEQIEASRRDRKPWKTIFGGQEVLTRPNGMRVFIDKSRPLPQVRKVPSLFPREPRNP